MLTLGPRKSNRKLTLQRKQWGEGVKLQRLSCTRRLSGTCTARQDG